MNIAVVGAGIAGITTALALHRKGFRVTVHEQAESLGPLGVGINLLPHAVEVLAGLGLAGKLAATGIDAKELVFMNRHGQEILVDPRGLAAGYAYPQYSIHRGELQMLLLDAARERLGPDAVRCGSRVVGAETLGDRVQLRVIGRGGAASTIDADLAIAADGIHSAIRAERYPVEGPPKWNGVQMWRGVTEGVPFLSGRSQIWAGSNAQKFVAYPISRRHADTGRALINWICDIRTGGGELPQREDWNRPGRLADFLPRYEGWRFPCLDIPAVIRGASAVYEFPMVDRDPLPRWSFGRVTLLGDAAHPMYPIGSNGASQAILDAATIAESLSSFADPVAALADYEAKRRPMTTEIVRMNRQQGIDVILDIVEERAPEGFARIEDVISRDELAAIVARYKQAAGHRQQPSVQS